MFAKKVFSRKKKASLLVTPGLNMYSFKELISPFCVSSAGQQFILCTMSM